jgi:hypothetical protein
LVKIFSPSGAEGFVRNAASGEDAAVQSVMFPSENGFTNLIADLTAGYYYQYFWTADARF